MALNWKYIQKKNGDVIFALCRGEMCIKEYNSLNLAYHREKESKDKIDNSIDDFLNDSKKVVEARMNGNETYHKITRIPIDEFRRQQRKFKK